MRWQIEGFVFCEKQQTLSSKNNTVQLEPMQVELLSYLCRHTNQIISREQLIEQVWRGRFITDNAVTKVINKLRKHFDDDPRQPKFIATFPKKGYKFIAQVTQHLETPSDISSQTAVLSTAATQTHSTSKTKIPLPTSLLILLLSVTVIGLILWLQSAKPALPITQVKALTRSAGNETWPQVSPKGEYLTYMEFGEQRIHLWVKSLINEKAVEISHGNSIGVGPAAWNSDGSKLVYLVANNETCQYYIREFNQLTLGEPKLIHNCPAGSFGRISFTHDDNQVIYTESTDRQSPYSIFAMDLLTGIKKRVNQPEQFIGGNSQFDLHPTQNKLLISSPDKQQWEGFYSLDLETDQLTLLFKQDAYICCGIWDHSGQRVVLMGEHPAYQLVSFDKTGADKQVIYSGSQLIRNPQRHSNGKDYLFRAGDVNQNAQFYDFASQTEHLVANTSVDDRLAVYSAPQDKVAFIGLSSGSEEVWLTDLQAKQPSKLTNFSDGRHIIDLVWSPKGDYLLALGLNQIYLIDSQSGKTERLKIPQVEIRGLSWKNDQEIAYSTNSKQGWQVNYYHIKSHQVSYAQQQWAYIQYSPEPSDWLWQAQDGKLFVGEGPRPINDKQLKQLHLVHGRQFNLKKRGDQWAWQQHSDGQYQLMFKKSDMQAGEALLKTDSYHFDLSAQGLLHNVTEKLNADIYQTVSN